MKLTHQNPNVCYQTTLYKMSHGGFRCPVMSLRITLTKIYQKIQSLIKEMQRITLLSKNF